MTRSIHLTVALLAIGLPAATAAAAQDDPTGTLPEQVTVTGHSIGYATAAQYGASTAHLGPLGETPILTQPYDIQTVPQDLIVNRQARSANDILRLLPSVQVESRQGVDISRPQSRGFEGSIVQNTRVDGMNIIGTTAYPAEELDNVQVLTGLAGALYGPAAPAGVFDYTFKRPTDAPLNRAILDYDSDSIITEHLDTGGRAGTNGWLGYRINLLDGNGTGPIERSGQNRVLVNADFDIHLSPSTVIELDQSHYYIQQAGYSGQFSYGGTLGSTVIPSPPDPVTLGYGQPGAGLRLTTDLGSARILSDLGNGWHLTAGGLYEVAHRGLYTINNNLTNNAGAFTQQQNFAAVAKFTAGSNILSLDASKRIFGLLNDVAIGTNGYINGQYSGINSIVVTLGKASLANPRIFTLPAVSNGGTYLSSKVTQQAIVLGDTIHLDRYLAVRTVFGPSWLSTDNYGTNGKSTGSYTSNNIFSHTESLIVTPTDRLTLYGTYGDSLQQGDTAPVNNTVKNPGQTVAPYRSEQYEVGAKYQLLPHLLVSAAGFHITRPYADTNPSNNVFEVIGEQRNWGVEFYAAGEIGPFLSVLGGFTWLDPKLLHTAIAADSDKAVVGVPDWQSNVSLDCHPAWARGAAATATVHYTGTRAATQSNNSFTAAYTTLDLGVRYTRRLWSRPVTGRLQLTNVTNERYFISIFPATINGGAGADSAWLGAPRAVAASLEVDF